MSALKKLNQYVNKVFLSVSVVLLAVVIIATTLQVFTRYILNTSLSGTDEIARFAFVWMSMLGASICVREHGHAVVSVLNDALKQRIRLQRFHQNTVELLMVIGAVILLIYGIQLVLATMEQRSAGLGIPISFTYACIPVGAAGMILNGIVNVMDSGANKKGGAAE